MSPTEIHKKGVAASASAVSIKMYSIWLFFGYKDKVHLSSAKGTRGLINTILKDSDGLSSEALDYLKDRKVFVEKLIDSLSNDQQEKVYAKERSEAGSKKLLDVLEEGVAGVYVYTLPHYEQFPYEPESIYEDGRQRTLYKVGFSKDVKSRIAQQISKGSTALPEDPVVKRVYSLNPKSLEQDLIVVEKKYFHFMLENAGHGYEVRSRRNEWFLTHLDFLDGLASILNLTVYGDEAEG